MSVFVNLFGRAQEEAAVAYLQSRWPEEGCGVFAGGKFIPVDNVARTKREAFKLPAGTFARYKVQAIVHSHCSDRHPFSPSQPDMEGQLESGVPWGIAWTSEDEAKGLLWWGDFRLDDPLKEREFVAGVYDCYSLLRSYMWQTRKIKLPEVPRDESWWQDGKDLFPGYKKAGAIEVRDEYREGDAVLMTIRSPVPNHCAIVTQNGLILHHLLNRLSCEEPLGRWHGQIVKHLRYP